MFITYNNTIYLLLYRVIFEKHLLLSNENKIGSFIMLFLYDDIPL